MGELTELAKEMGKKGGSSTFKKHGRDHYVLMGKKSVESKRNKKNETKLPIDNNR